MCQALQKNNVIHAQIHFKKSTPASCGKSSINSSNAAFTCSASKSCIKNPFPVPDQFHVSTKINPSQEAASTV